MIRLLPFALLLAPSVAAAEAMPYDLAQSRLRACVTSGATGAPRNTLGEAVQATRALCRPQLDRLYAASDRRIAAESPQAGEERLAQRRKQARRRIDHDVAVLIANATGLRP